ncbi:unnamed protein product [Moneuplotes crassus]|uniref:Cyclic nucleotide-binding domain-containing protein n=1 Tax=Euplotes crassus TaxID=5936 RepID=A0AAD1XAC5_EUPCR|nr:unnamed protein product [Moneuplotes crassus]
MLPMFQSQPGWRLLKWVVLSQISSKECGTELNKIFKEQKDDLKKKFGTSKRGARSLNHYTIEILTRRKKEAIQYYTMRLIIDNIYFNKCYDPTNDYITNILQKEEQFRNLFDIRALSTILDKAKFFQKLRQNGDHETVISCYKKLTYLKIDYEDHEVIKYGTYGSYFYVILNGTVAVYIPNFCNVKLNILEYYKLICDYSDMILLIDGKEKWELPDLPEQLVESARTMNLKRIVDKLDNIEKPHVHNTHYSNTLFSRSLKNKRLNYKELASQMTLSPGVKLTIDSSNLETENYTIKYLKKISELKSGDSFGDLSLIYNKPRLATIKTVTPAEFALLSKEQYDSTLKALEQQKIEQKIEELDCIAFFKEYSRAFKSRLLYAVKIYDLHKDQVVFKEGMKDNKLYFIVRGEFEVSKNIILHSDPRLPQFEYKLLEPAEEAKRKHLIFFKQHSNLIAGQSTKEINEIRKFMDKRTNKSLIIRRVTDKDTLGLEEVFMRSPQRFLSAKCTSKKARIISIQSDAFFARIKRDDIIKMLTSITLKKLKVLSQSIDNFISHVQNEEEIQKIDQIMDKIEILEPMMTSIYLQNNKKLEAQNLRSFAQKSKSLKQAKKPQISQIKIHKNEPKNSKTLKFKRPKHSGIASTGTFMHNLHKRTKTTTHSNMFERSVQTTRKSSPSRNKQGSSRRRKVMARPKETQEQDDDDIIINLEKGIEVKIQSARTISQQEDSIFNSTKSMKKKIDRIKPYLGVQKEDEFQRLSRIYKNEIEKDEHLIKCQAIRNQYPTLLSNESIAKIINLKIKDKKISNRKSPKGCFRSLSAMGSLSKKTKEYVTEDQRLEISNLSLKSPKCQVQNFSPKCIFGVRRNTCSIPSNFVRRKSLSSSAQKRKLKNHMNKVLQKDLERIVDEKRIERIDFAAQKVIRPRSSINQTFMTNQRQFYHGKKVTFTKLPIQEPSETQNPLRIDFRTNSLPPPSTTNLP